MRKTRGMLAEKSKGPKAFKDWLEEVRRLAAGLGGAGGAVGGCGRRVAAAWLGISPAVCDSLACFLAGPPCRSVGQQPPLPGAPCAAQAELEREPAAVPTYLTAAVGPPQTTAARKFCSVCGDTSGYTCTRCGSRYCSRKCYAVHSETRCLTFMA